MFLDQEILILCIVRAIFYDRLYEEHSDYERDSEVMLSMYTNFKSFKNSKAQIKFSYIQDFGMDDIFNLEKKIREHLEISNHVFVGFGEPIISYKEPKHGWDNEHDCYEGPFYYTDDFINRFAPTDKVTFFANAVSHVNLQRPFYYLNNYYSYYLNNDYSNPRMVLRLA